MKLFSFLKNRNVIVIALFLQLSSPLFAQQKIDFIVADQKRIDKLDGKEDGKVETGDSLQNEIAKRVYFELIDQIQIKIETGSSLESSKKIFRDYVFRSLRLVYEKNFQDPARFEKTFKQQLLLLEGVEKKELLKALQTNSLLSLSVCGIVRAEPETETFLLEKAKLYPEKIIENYGQFIDRPYAGKVIDVAAKTAPLVAKKYILEGNPINNLFKKSTDSSIVVLLKLNQEFGKKTNAYVLLDEIVKQKISLQKADSIGKNPIEYLNHLMKIRFQKNPIGEQSVEQELEISSLKFVRNINDLHNENDDATRFKGIANFSPEQLYTLIVYSEEEIFTSTFNGIYKRFLLKLGKKNGYEFLNSVGENRFRVFIKQCASYGKLKSFLATMTISQKENLMREFASDLETNNIAQAVEVADAYTSIDDSITQKKLQKTIQSEFERNVITDDKKGAAIYGLLSSLFVNGSLFKENWYGGISDKYKIPPLDKIKNEQLFKNNKKCIWYMCFYDDDDGDASYKSFINTFREKNWKIDTHDSLYVTIESKNGNPVLIYANKPKGEYEGQALIEAMLDSAGIVPDVLIHRGHSYYAYKTIEKTKPSIKIFVLGSCGGYHSLSSIIEKAAEVNIISSKQIGVQGVNNPLLKIIADTIREGKDIEWQQIWKSLDTKLKGTESYNRFLDYIPPHKNLGAIFIKAYNHLNQE